LSSLISSNRAEAYLRHIEEELLIKGGRWIATFNIAIRKFKLSFVGTDKDLKKSKDYDLLVYGGVRHKGFLLSAAFAFLASPTYKVACAVIHLKRASDVKWSVIVDRMREVRKLMDVMDFEWVWLLFIGEEKLPLQMKTKIERHADRTLGLLYADIKNNELFISSSFISRRGEKLFHPRNLDKGKSKSKGR
jgi:hypothetical protein